MNSILERIVFISASRQLLALGGLLAIGFVSQMAISFTDAALVARLGADAFAGTVLALSMFSFVMLMGLGIITAVSPKLAHSFRKGNIKDLRSWFTQGNWLSLAVGAFSMLVLFNTDGILQLLGQSQRIASIAQEYNSGAAVGVVFFYFYVNIRGLVSAVGNPKPLTWIMLVAVPVNFLLTSLLIFGLSSLPGLGVFGAGIGSTTIRFLIVGFAAVLLLRGREFQHLRLAFLRPTLELKKMAHLLRIGAPIGFRILLGEGFPSLIAFMIAADGAEVVAAHAVGIRIDTLISVLSLGISSAATTLAAWHLADDNTNALRQLRASMAVVGAAYVLVLSGIVYFFYDILLSTIFGLTDPSVTDASRKLLPFVLLSFTLGTWGTMHNGMLVGLLDTFLPTIVVVFSYWGIGLVGGYFVAEFLGTGFIGYWIAMVVASLVVAVFNYLRLGYLIGRKFHSVS